jgi:hypothetical protein
LLHLISRVRKQLGYLCSSRQLKLLNRNGNDRFLFFQYLMQLWGEFSNLNRICCFWNVWHLKYYLTEIDVFNMNDDFVKFSENLTHCSSKSKIMSLTCKVGAGKIFICLDYFHSDSCFLTFKNHIICQKNTKLWNNYFLTSNFYIDSFVYLFKERSKSLLKVEIFK